MTETLVAPARTWTLAEEFLLIGMGESWDRAAEGELNGRGAALAGALLLELLQAGHLQVQRDRFEVVGQPEDAGLRAAAEELARHREDGTRQTVVWLARRVPRLLGPWKEALAARGVLAHREWKAAGLLPRSEARIVDPTVPAKRKDRLTRFLAGGGTADAQTILLLGLLEASGTLDALLPGPTLSFNRKRVQGLLTGRDAMGYRVDPDYRRLQDTAVHAILDGVRSTRGLPIG